MHLTLWELVCKTCGHEFKENQAIPGIPRKIRTHTASKEKENEIVKRKGEMEML